MSRRDLFNYTVCFTPDVRGPRASFFKQLSMQLRREPIKVQARDLVSRQEPVPRISECRENSFGILPENNASNEREENVPPRMRRHSYTRVWEREGGGDASFKLTLSQTKIHAKVPLRFCCKSYSIPEK